MEEDKKPHRPKVTKLRRELLRYMRLTGAVIRCEICDGRDHYSVSGPKTFDHRFLRLVTTFGLVKGGDDGLDGKHQTWILP